MVSEQLSGNMEGTNLVTAAMRVTLAMRPHALCFTVWTAVSNRCATVKLTQLNDVHMGCSEEIPSSTHDFTPLPGRCASYWHGDTGIVEALR